MNTAMDGFDCKPNRLAFACKGCGALVAFGYIERHKKVCPVRVTEGQERFTKHSVLKELTKLFTLV